MICDFPMTCKGGNEENGLFGSAGKMAVPGFNVVKSAYDKICANLKVLEQSPAFKNGSPNTMKLYQKLVKQKEVFLQAIKDHPGYEDFVQKREKQREDDAQKNKSMKQLSEGELEEFRQKWKKMSSPRKVAYLGALAIINRALASLTEDKYWCQYPAKKRLFKFLVVHRNKLCRKLAKFPPIPSESLECFRFKPCSQKIVKAWEVQYKNKRGNISRKLLVDFDAVSKRLGLPKTQFIDYSIEKYQKFISSIKRQMNTSLTESEDEKAARMEELSNKLQVYQRRVNFLKELKIEKEASKAQQAEMLKAICDEKYGPIEPKEIKPEVKKKNEWVFDYKITSEFPPPGSWQDYNSLKPFSHNLEMPSRIRLENILEHQKKLLNEIEKIDKIKEGALGSKEKKREEPENEPQSVPSNSKKDNKRQSKSKTNKVDDEKKEKKKKKDKDVKNPVVNEADGGKKKEEKKKKKNKEAEKHVVDESQSKPQGPAAPTTRSIQNKQIRSLKEGISSNIKFIEELLANYPEQQFPPHYCKPEIEKEVKRKKFNISSEACGESFSWPKWRILQATHEKYEELIKKFEADVRNKEALKEFPVQDDEGESQGDEKKVKSKLLKSPEEMELELKEKDLKSRQRVYEKLVAANEKVIALLAQHDKRWEQLITQGSGGISFYSHNLVCNRDEVVPEKPKEYPLTHPRKDLFIAQEKRMRAAYEKHMMWIAEKLKIKGIEKDEIEKVLREMEHEKEEGERAEDTQEIEPPLDDSSKGKKAKKGDSSKKDKTKKEVDTPEDVTATKDDSSKKKKSKKDKNEVTIEEIPQNDDDGEEEQVENKSKLADYVRRYVKQAFNLERLLATLDSKTDEDKNQAFHAFACNSSDMRYLPTTVFDFSKEGPADLKYTEKLAQPKKNLLKSTYESFAKVMSAEKQQRILCQLNKVREPSKPEDLEASVREVVKSKRKSRCIAGKIKLQVARQLYDKLSKVLKKKIALEMCKTTMTTTPVSVPFREIDKTILMTLMVINGTPRSSQECDMYHKFTSILRNFIIEALQKDLK